MNRMILKSLAPLALCAAIFGGQASAAPNIPACMTDKGVDAYGNRMIDGGYTVEVDSTSYDKAGLLSFLASFNANENVYPKEFPGIYGNELSFNLGPQAVSSDEAFDHLVVRVNGEITRIQAMPGVTVRCQMRIHPG